MALNEKPSLIECLQELPDPRVTGRCDHKLLDLLVIALCTLLAGGESFPDMQRFALAKWDWLKSFLELPGGVPSHDTFNRLFQALDPQQFLEVFATWTQGLRRSISEEIVAVDGKALRRARGRGQSACAMVSAWARDNGLVLGQLKVAEQSNEITAVPPLLRALELGGCIVTADAMGCQKEIAREIIEADAQYVLALKGNQGTAFAEIQSFLDDALQRREPGLAFVETVDKEHGRLEIRRYWQSADLGWFADRADWAELKSVGVVEAVREVTGQAPSLERRYYLSSLGVDIGRFARAVRGHWSVENSLHWSLDVSFGEDQHRARTAYAAENLATLRRLALNLLKQDTSKKSSLRGKILWAGWDNSFLAGLLKI
jgi:predicted transposase YbfD/YdcC